MTWRDAWKIGENNIHHEPLSASAHTTPFMIFMDFKIGYPEKIHDGLSILSSYVPYQNGNDLGDHHHFHHFDHSYVPK